jgi:hypothetical protein
MLMDRWMGRVALLLVPVSLVLLIEAGLGKFLLIRPLFIEIVGELDLLEC